HYYLIRRQIMESLTNSLIEAVLTVVGILVAAAISYFASKLKRQLDIWADADNLGIVQEIVDMGVELAEKELTGKEGEEKFNHAAQYVAMMANRYGIDISDEFLKGAIQAGYKRMSERDNKHEK